jgi:hypothetical protein
MAIFAPSRTLFADVDPATPVVIFNHSGRTRAPVFVCLPAMGVAASFYTPFAEALAQAARGRWRCWPICADKARAAALARRGARFGYHGNRRARHSVVDRRDRRAVSRSAHLSRRP